MDNRAKVAGRMPCKRFVQNLTFEERRANDEYMSAQIEKLYHDWREAIVPLLGTANVEPTAEPITPEGT